MNQTGAPVNNSDNGSENRENEIPHDKFRIEGWKLWLTWLLRIAIGATFIFSGYVKGIDPWGTIFKINDYLSVIGIKVWPSLVNAGAIAMCVFEFLIGIFILLGCFRRSTPILGLIFMAVMLPLTAWIWIAHPVSDCGCFGDAFIISDAATFWKNVILTLGFIWLIKFNGKVSCLVIPYLQWIVLVVSGLFLFVIAEIGYLYQPLLDFRPYPKGSKLAEIDNAIQDEEDEYEFVYKKGEIREVFGENDSLPSESEGWEFVETRLKSDTQHPETRLTHKSFRVWSGDEDVTEDIIPGEGPKLWLMMPELDEVSISETWSINTIYDWCDRHGVEMAAIVDGTPEQIAEWKDASLAEYPVYNTEDTMIKEVVRGKVSLVYTLDGDIIWKRTLRSAWRPGFEDDSLSDLGQLEENNSALLRNIRLIYIAVILVLVAASFSSPLFKGFKLKSNHSRTR